MSITNLTRKTFSIVLSLLLAFALVPIWALSPIEAFADESNSNETEEINTEDANDESVDVQNSGENQESESISENDSSFSLMASSGSFTYDITSSNTAKITGYTGFGGYVAIPQSLDGHMVEGITYEAFKGNTNITGLSFGATLQYIERDAFNGCSNLSTLTLPENLNTIRSNAFYGCTSLSTINYNCRNLSSSYYDGVFGKAGQGLYSGITVNFGSDVKSIPSDLFRTYEAADSPNVSVINFGSSIQTIGSKAFYRLDDITSISLPSSLQTIDSHAFQGCNNLKSVSFPSGLQKIDYGAFSGCSSLISITLPANLNSLEDGAFEGCSYLSDITFNCRELASCDSYGTFNNAGSLSSSGIAVTFGSSCQSVPARLFDTNPYNGSEAPNVTSVTFASGVKSIGESSFADLTELKSVSFPSSLQTIGTNAFVNCSGLTSVNFNSTLQEIGYYAFQQCTALKSVTLPENLNKLGRYVFNDCTHLTSITIQSKELKLDYGSSNYAFRNAGINDSGITVTFTSSCKKIPAYIFNAPSESEAPNIIRIIVPASLANIDKGAFDGPKGFDVYGYSGSAAEYFCSQHGVSFVSQGYDDSYPFTYNYGSTSAVNDESNNTNNSNNSSSTQTMYRLYNPNSGEHFYTASTTERNQLKKVGWKYEGEAWTAPKSSNTPVYRLYSGTDHHYTTSAAERDSLVRAGWSDEGIGWYSDDAKGVPLYRQFNPNVNPSARYNNSGSHNYTTSKGENDHLVSIGWREEGIGWYGCK